MTTRIEPQHGLDLIKTYVPGKPIEDVQRELGIYDVIKMASNENPFGSSPKAKAAMRDALDLVNYYPDGQSYQLRHALANALTVEPEAIMVGNGADGLIAQVCLAYLDEQSDVIVGECSFPVYDIYAHTMRARLVKVPLKDFRLDLNAMADRIDGRTKLIFVCNPNNPTGTIVTADEVATFMERVPDHTLVVFDEAYCEFVDSDEYPDTLSYLRDGRENVMILRTFSKIYGLAGIRLGYAIAHPALLGPLFKVKEPFSVNLLAQAAGLAALKDEEFLEKTILSNRAGRAYLYREFDRLGLSYLESHTNFVLMHVGSQSVDVVQRLMEMGVIVRPCGGYGIPEFLRVTVGTPDQNERFVRTLEAILA
jgi:histidinol-phosphate aminotransferase